MMSSLENIETTLSKLKDPEKAKILQRFFKTGQGEYAEGDQFLGIRVPELRKLSRQYKKLSHPDVHYFIRSPFHECRQLALFILVLQFKSGNDLEKKEICQFYLDSLSRINHWDLVDCSAEHIIGPYLLNNTDDVSETLIGPLLYADNFWHRRIAVLATFYCIKRQQFDFTLKLASYLLDDPADLIHKAVGWMLREIGNRDLETETRFLKAHYQAMPRTMLRYAIEKFPPETRKQYLKGLI